MDQMKQSMRALAAPRRITVLVAVLATLLAGCTGPVMVVPANSTVPSPVATPTPTPAVYRELLNSEIRGIDPETIAGYLAGEGLGLALPAELNGYPGPRHLLELRAELELTAEQVEQIQALFDTMQPQVIELGKAILAAEAKLENDFRNQTIDAEALRLQLQQIADLQAQLRFVHLHTHLDTVEILSPHQVQQYNALRGYAQMPAGHEHSNHP